MPASRTILLLGGSRQQVIAIERAKQLGYRTVLCDYLPDNPGQVAADVFYQVSTTDRESVLAVAEREGAKGVLAYSSDPASATAGYVAERLGLPSNPLNAIETMSEKHLFRSFLHQHGLPCPGAFHFTSGEPLSDIAQKLSDYSLPIVIKPTDSSGSKGVTVIHRYDGLEAAVTRAREHSRNGILIAEEFIERTHPNVIGGDVFVVDGQVRFWGLMECLRDDALGGLVPVGKVLPPNLDHDVLCATKEVLQRLVTALGIRFGELNVEVIIGSGGVPYVLELGSRAGGNMIPVQLSDASGIDLVAANVRCAMGEDPGDISWDSSRRKSDAAFATYVIHSGKAGVFQGISLSEEVEPFIYREVLYLNPGDPVEVFDGANKALGIMFLRFPSSSRMFDVLSRPGEHIIPLIGARDEYV